MLSGLRASGKDFVDYTFSRLWLQLLTSVPERKGVVKYSRSSFRKKVLEGLRGRFPEAIVCHATSRMFF